MTISNLYNFLSEKQYIGKNFSEFAHSVQQVCCNRKKMRQHHLQNFIDAIPNQISSQKQQGVKISERDWQNFTKAFSSFGDTVSDKEGFLETTFLIETSTGRHFMKDPHFCPIVLRGPNNKTAIVPKSAFKSEIFKNMVSGPFSEAKNQEILLSHICPDSFDILVSFFKGKAFRMKLANFQEILTIVHLYRLPALFIAALESLNFEIRSSKDEKSVSENTKKLCDFFGFDQTTLQLSTTTESTQPTRLDLNAIYLNILPDDPQCEKQLFNLFIPFGECFEKGIGVEKNLTPATNLYFWAAQQGNSEAQCRVGCCVEKGELKDVNPEASFDWYKRAEEKNYPKAQFLLAHCYEEGIGCVKDMKEHMRYLELAACGGYGAAQWRLANHYKSGTNCKRNDKKALEWFEKAANQNFEKAQYSLGICYAKGQGVETDLTKAKSWFEKAALQGNTDAQFQAGWLNLIGDENHEQDLVKAIHWLTLAAQANHAEAQWQLGACYEKGLGVKRNLDEADELFEAAFKNGSKTARELY